jgi:hypothetical protein
MGGCTSGMVQVRHHLRMSAAMLRPDFSHARSMTEREQLLMVLGYRSIHGCPAA